MSVTAACIVAFVTLLFTAPQDKRRDNSSKVKSQTQSEKAENLVVTPIPQDGDTIEYANAEEAYRVGAAFYNSRSFKNSRAPFEAAIRLAKDDEMKLKVYQALLPAYREIPEFEPFQTAAEFVIANSPQSTERSLTRRAFAVVRVQSWATRQSCQALRNHARKGGEKLPCRLRPIGNLQH